MVAGLSKAVKPLVKSADELLGGAVQAVKKLTPQLDSVLDDAAKSGKYPASEIDRVKTEWSKGNMDAKLRPSSLGSESENLMMGVDNRYQAPEIQKQNAIDTSTKWNNNSELLSDGQITTKQTERVDELYPTEGPQGRKKASQIANQGKDKKDKTGFFARKMQQVLGPFAHHHILDMEFIGRALNRVDHAEIIQHLKKFGIEVGDRSKNLIAAMDEKAQSARWRLNPKEDIFKQMAANPKRPDWTATTFADATAEQDRIANDLLKTADLSFGTDLPKGHSVKKIKGTGKMAELDASGTEIAKFDDITPYANPGDPHSYGLPRGDALKDGKYKPAKYWPLEPEEGADLWRRELAGTEITKKQRSAAYQNRYKRLDIDNKKVRWDPKEHILSGDHIDAIHGAYNSPKFTIKREVEAMIASGEWRDLTPVEAAQYIAEVFNVSRNIALNVSFERLKVIKTAIRKTNSGELERFILSSPDNIRKWVLDNKGKASRLKVKKLSFAEITEPLEVGKNLKPEELDELQAVFATELEPYINFQEFAQSFSSRL